MLFSFFSKIRKCLYIIFENAAYFFPKSKTWIQHPQGELYQSILKEMTGQGSVPNVFINGKHVGGNDDTYALHETGQLVSSVSDAKSFLIIYNRELTRKFC